MANRRAALVFLALAGLPLWLYGQNSTQSDLSGTWQLNLEKSKLPKSVKATPETLTIKQAGLSIEFDYESNGKKTVEVYVADKKDKVLREIPAAGSRIVAKAYWKGSTLIAERRADFSMSSPLGLYEIMKTKDAWTLSADGSVLTDKLTSEETQSFRVYERQK